MAETVSLFFAKYLSPELVVFIISLLPILELRGGLVAASLLGVPWAKAMVIALIGNMLPVPFIILFIEKILHFLKDHGPIKGFARWIERKGMTKGAELQRKYPKQVMLGLFIFVAIPLPGTGAWTGALVASFLGLDLKKSAPPICLGVVGASLIMLVITYVIPWLVGLK